MNIRDNHDFLLNSDFFYDIFIYIIYRLYKLTYCVYTKYTIHTRVDKQPIEI